MLRKLMLALVSLLILAGGATLSNEGYRLTIRLFIHYLGGSGESVTIHLPQVLDTCPQRSGLVSMYKTSYGYALGKFTCNKAHGHDLYDFPYEDNPRVCRKLLPSRYLDDLNQGRLGAALGDVPADLGRCVVGHGYGRSFNVYITR